MKTYLVIFALSLIQLGCAITRAESNMMLEKRADLDGSRSTLSQLGSIENPLMEPVRTKPQIADIWVHPHELPNGDYFRGAWIRTIVRGSSWQYKDPSPLLIEEKKIPSKKHIPKDRSHLKDRRHLRDHIR